MSSLAERIKKLRQLSGMNTEEFAKKLGIGAGTLNSYERGITTPSGKKLIQISEQIERSPEWLLFGQEASSMSTQSDIQKLSDVGRGNALESAVSEVAASPYQGAVSCATCRTMTEAVKSQPSEFIEPQKNYNCDGCIKLERDLREQLQRENELLRRENELLRENARQQAEIEQLRAQLREFAAKQSGELAGLNTMDVGQAG